MAKLREALEKFQQGNTKSALDVVEAVLKDEPGQLDALVLAGQIHHQQGSHEQAVHYLAKALELVPGHVALSANLAAVHLALGQPMIAEPLARSAVSRQADHFGARLNLGLALFAQRHYESSVDELSAALKLQPDSLLALKNLAHALQRLQQRHFGTRAMLQEVLERSPGEPETLAMLADSHIQNAETDKGLGLFEELLDSEMDIPVNDASRYHDSYLLALQYRPQTGPKDLLEASRQWAARYSQCKPVEAATHKGKKLRIGWISPRFASGPVACFLLPVLEAFDRSQSEHYLYAARLHEGPTSKRFRQQADAWRELDGQSVDEAAQLIASDELDILVDLAGHSPGGMLTTLCRRPAQVQVSWMDSFFTTGVEHIDAFISDPYLSPPGDEQYFTEMLVRLEHGRLCYRPQIPVPEAPRQPDASSIVFASFNRLSKLGDEVLGTWASILNAVPGSRLVLRNTMFDDVDVCTAFYQRCDDMGLRQDRVSLYGYCGYAEIMASYGDVDIVLDPFPFSGCTTTCDALWMGVPVITRTGSTLVSRQSGAILNALELGEFITQSTQDYIAATIALARDDARRSELRASLRKKMQNIFVPQIFSNDLLQQLRKLASRTWE
jgi:predicted O-linked N-acetylglucosamine transferase (SPINDLY family)